MTSKAGALFKVEYLKRCAEGEGGRARLCMEGYGDPATAAYFAREAARYATLLLDAEGPIKSPTTQED